MKRLVLGFSGCWVFGVLALFAVTSFADDAPQLRVNLTSQPSGATVIIDGRERGTTPVTLFDIAPGRHHLKYRLSGYEDSDTFFNTHETPGPYIEKNGVLEEVKGLLLLKTEPAGADIQIDGVSVGQTPRLITNLHAKGNYSVKFRKAGYQDQTISVRFEGRKPLVREERLVMASGAVEISSEPAGATVTVNGIEKGVTPIRVEEVPRGRATVKFHLDGFEDEVRELAINAGDVQTLPIVLKGLPGALHLSSVPEGARFYVNDGARGKGPVSIPGLKPGTYEVRAELEGYGTLSKSIAIANGESVNEEFRLSNVMGRIEVRTSPAGAQVFLDGRLVGTTKSADSEAEFSDILPIENVMEGEHTLVMKMEGYADKTCHPSVKSEQTSKFHNQRLRRIFKPDVEIVTVRGTYKGVLLKRAAGSVMVEVRPGITQSFAQEEIRKITFLNDEK